MTAAKSTLRRRRTTTNNIPRALAEWFAGNREPGPGRSSVPWCALIVPDYALLPERWLAWSAENPGVPPPAGYEWLNDPDAPEQPSPTVVARAQAMVARHR